MQFLLFTHQQTGRKTTVPVNRIVGMKEMEKGTEVYCEPIEPSKAYQTYYAVDSFTELFKQIC